MSDSEVHAKIAIRNQQALGEALKQERVVSSDLNQKIKKLETDLTLLTIKVQQMHQSYTQALAVLGRGPTN